MKRIILLLCLSLLSLNTLAAGKARTLILGTEPYYAPFDFLDENNQIIGFDIDIGNEICKRINAACTFANIPFDNLIPSLMARRIDAIIAGMEITEERKKKIQFSIPYYTDQAVFLTLSDDITDIESLNGKRVGVGNGTIHQQFILNKHAKINAVSYNNNTSAVLDLTNNRVDALFLDEAVANEWSKNNSDINKKGKKFIHPAYEKKGLGFGFRKNNDLAQEFNQALAEMQTDGTLDAIHEKWFGEKTAQ